jgi:hypothetical protein
MAARQAGRWSSLNWRLLSNETEKAGWCSHPELARLLSIRPSSSSFVRRRHRSTVKIINRRCQMDSYERNLEEQRFRGTPEVTRRRSDTIEDYSLTKYLRKSSFESKRHGCWTFEPP